MSTKRKPDSDIYSISGPFGNEFFDDCPICQALKKAEEEKRNPTLSELKEATLKAKEKGAVVGGSLLEDDLN